MNERDLEIRLRDAYRVQAGNVDPGALGERVHSIPATVEPERRRWWHRFRSGATRHAGPGGTQMRGATNMLAPTAIIAGFGALALGTAFLAVSNDPQVAPQPAAPSDDWAIVTGTQTLVSDSPDCSLAGLYQLMSDPRLDGELCLNFQQEGGEEGGEDASGFWTSMTVTNDDGSWQGQAIGFADERGAHYHSGWLEGHGDYEGLVFINQLTESYPDAPSGGINMDVVGLLYAGELPPMVDPAWAADPPPMDAE